MRNKTAVSLEFIFWYITAVPVASAKKWKQMVSLIWLDDS